MSTIPFITFIIPSIGRDSLKDTIKSLLNLKDENWNAIIIFDGIKKFDAINDQRIKIIEIEKTGSQDKEKSRAGLVRNIGMNNIHKDCEWVGFVDDDDCLSPEYINNLKLELKIFSSKPEIIIFRMAYENGLVLPMQFDKNIIMKKVGISFCIRKEISDKYKFDNHIYEDFLYLKNLQNNKYKILISSFISYYIRCNSYNGNENKKFPKILLNFE